MEAPKPKSRSTFVQYPLARGVTLYVWPTQQFKKVTVHVCFHHPLGADASLTAIVPRVLMRGSRQHPSTAELAQVRESLYGLELDGDIGKIGRDQTVDFSLVGVNPPLVGEGEQLLREQLGLLAEVMIDPLWEAQPGANGPQFRSDYVEQEKRALRERIASLINDKRSYALYRLHQEMYAGDPFGLYPYGRVEEVESIRPEQVAAQYRRLLDESPVTLVVVGDVEPAAIKGLVEQLWGEHWHDRREQLPPVGGQAAPRTVRRVDERQPTQQALLYLGYLTGGITYASDSYPALLLYSGILGGFPHSKLFIQVREKASLAYFTWTRLEASVGALVATCGIDARHREQALEIIQRQVEAMAQGQISDAEWEATVEGLCTGLRSVNDSPSALTGRLLMGVANGRQRPADEMIADIRKVTKDQVVEIAQKVALDTIYFLGEQEAQA